MPLLPWSAYLNKVLHKIFHIFFQHPILACLKRISRRMLKLAWRSVEFVARKTNIRITSGSTLNPYTFQANLSTLVICVQRSSMARTVCRCTCPYHTGARNRNRAVQYFTLFFFSANDRSRCSILNEYIAKDELTGLYTCTACGKTNKDKGNLRKHVEVHFPGQFTYSCDVCTKSFNGKNSYYVHMATYHKKWSALLSAIQMCTDNFVPFIHVFVNKDTFQHFKAVHFQSIGPCLKNTSRRIPKQDISSALPAARPTNKRTASGCT